MRDDLVPGVGLADVLQKLRSELDVAQVRLEERDDKPLLFMTEASVELEFVVESGKAGEAKIDFKVVSFGGKVNRSNTVTHRLHLTLTPTDPVAAASGQGSRENLPERPPGTDQS